MSSRTWLFRVVVTTAVAMALCGLVAASPSLAQVVAPTSSPSDPRAQFVSGNVVTCAGAGIVSTPGVDIIQVGAPENNPASDPNVSGVVTPRAGGGEELSVTITGANVVVDAVIVKGGDGYNLYSNPSFLPPALAPANQHYIAPLNGGGNVPVLSHWFICYHETTPLPTGTLQVTKAVQVPDGRPVTPLPTSFSALVNCNDGNPAHQNVIMNFNNGGGRSTTGNLTGIPPGTVCTVVEQSGGAPLVTYTPVGANAPGITITAGAGVVVNIINDFSTVPVQRGVLHFTKVLLPPPAGVQPPPSFTVEVACDDGTTGLVTLPGTGGDGTPDISVRTLSLCTLVEDISALPPGWTRTYSVNGGPPSATPPFVPVVDTATIAITVTNDAVAVEPTDPNHNDTHRSQPTTTISGGGVGPDMGGSLPATGRSTAGVMAIAALLTLCGIGVVTAARRPARRKP